MVISKPALLALLLLVAPLRAEDGPAPLTPIEQLRVENTNLRRVIVQQQIDDLTVRVAALKADLEATRPGWTWAPETGQWTKRQDAK